MRASTRHLSCHLAEWYRPDVTQPDVDDLLANLETAAAALRADGRSVALLVTLVVPTDEVVYGLFTAESAQLVSELCQRAGNPAERLSTDVSASIEQNVSSKLRETPDSSTPVHP